MKKLLLLGALALLSAGAFGKTFLIDVRTPDEYAAGHLEGAINIDHQVIGPRISMAGVAKDDDVIVYCRSGRRSSIAKETLNGLGYRKVQDYGSMDDARRRLQAK